MSWRRARTSVFAPLILVVGTLLMPAGQAKLNSQETQAVSGHNDDVEILSDTRGVDFQPYIGQVLHMVLTQWTSLLPEEARPPKSAVGVTLIRFTINPDGNIAAMHLDGSNHDEALNRAAWGAITSVGQFPSLPSAFDGPKLELRVRFQVNQPSTNR